MRVFKFGGASVCNPEAVKNVLRIIRQQGDFEMVVVVSAMGKMTNALEQVVQSYCYHKESLDLHLEKIIAFHRDICKSLFPDNHPIFGELKEVFRDMRVFMERNKSDNYDYIYDQLVPNGELLSTKILSAYFDQHNLKHQWLDARKVIKTDAHYREGKLNWENTEQRIKSAVHKEGLTLTQGFIGSDENNWSTTLGREGSDYTAGIFAYCLEATEVTIWKNVEGVLNADPQKFPETTLLNRISYQEAIEMAFYGASVIHPKTLQPLQRKDIKLYVRCFLNPVNPGTVVMEGPDISPKVPCFIVKNDLILLSLSTLDFSFFVEENISEVFALFHQYQMKVWLIQNSAISFSVCLKDKYNKASALITELRHHFKVSFNRGVSLYTIRHFDERALHNIQKAKEVLLEQHTRQTVQLITKN